MDTIREVAMILDASETYRYFDKNEIQWEYIYDKIGEDEGWWAWMTRPGGTEICIGRVPEEEVIKKMESNHPLTQDDLIDLELWIKSGGLDQYQPRTEEK